MSRIKNMGAATVRVNEGVIVDGTAGDDSHALIITGSIHCSTDGYFDRIYLGGGDGTVSTISNGNSDTYIQMQGNDVINLVAGSKNFVQIVEGSSNSRLVINENGLDVDFRVETQNRSHSIFSDAANDVVYIGGYPANEPAGNDVAVYISGSIDRKMVISSEVVLTGNIEISQGTLSISGLTFPSTDGTNGQVLKTDGSGNITWQDDTQSQSSGGGSSSSSSLITGFTSIGGASGVVNHDCSTNHMFYHSYISGAISPNFTNLSISSGETTVTKLILDQGDTPYSIEGVSVGGTEASLFWEGSRPMAYANTVSFAKFEILIISNSYNVICSFSSTVWGGPVSIPSDALLFLDASDSDSYSGSGTTWYDLSDSGNDATLVNTPTWNDSNKLFQFSGNSNQHMTLPTGFADFTNGATFFFVADLGTGNHWERLLDFSSGGTPINVGRNSTGTTMTLEYYNPGKTATSSNIIVNNTLANYVVTTDGSNAKFYRNSTLITNNSFSLTPDNNSRSQNYIGRSRAAADAYYEGEMAVVAIFNRALTESEITDLYNHYKDIYDI